VLLPSTDEQGGDALACSTFAELTEDDELELIDADSIVRAARLVQLADHAYTDCNEAEPWAGRRCQ
jgi:hypothetical protein